MAHSIVEFRGKREVFGDTDLLFVLHFLVDALSHRTRDTASALAHELSRSFEGCTPGCLIVPLDDLSQHASSWREFCPALLDAIDKIKSFGGLMPKQEIEMMWRADDGVTWLSDVSTAPYVDAARRLARLCLCNPRSDRAGL